MALIADANPETLVPVADITINDRAGVARSAKIPAVTLARHDGTEPPAMTSSDPGYVVGRAALPSATFSRPADTAVYASGDLVANSTTAGSVTPMSFTVARVAAGSGSIRRVRLRKTDPSITNASFRLHLYSASPTVSNGDNGVWLTDKSANYMGTFTITLDRAFTDGATGNAAPAVGPEINFALASGQVIYGLLEVRAAYVPVSGETFTVELEVLQN